jgi:hypothetical protein
VIPEGLPAVVTSEGNILMTHGIGHDAMLDDAGTMNLVRYLLHLPMVNLGDAIEILKVISGAKGSITAYAGDVNRNGSMGLEEAILILQLLSGLR